MVLHAPPAYRPDRGRDVCVRLRSHLECLLQSFKDHLKLPLANIPAGTRSIGDSDAASSLRSGPGGKPSSLWSWVRGATRWVVVEYNKRMLSVRWRL